MQWDSWNMFEYAYTQMKGQFDWTSAGKLLFNRKWYHFLYGTCPPVSQPNDAIVVTLSWKQSLQAQQVVGTGIGAEESKGDNPLGDSTSPSQITKRKSLVWIIGWIWLNNLNMHIIPIGNHWIWLNNLNVHNQNKPWLNHYRESLVWITWITGIIPSPGLVSAYPSAASAYPSRQRWTRWTRAPWCSPVLWHPTWPSRSSHVARLELIGIHGFPRKMNMIYCRYSWIFMDLPNILEMEQIANFLDLRMASKHRFYQWLPINPQNELTQFVILSI